MKKKIYKRLTLISTFALALVGLASCGNKEKTIKYSVKFISNDPDTSDAIAPDMYNDITVKKGETFDYASYNPTYSGYKFVGWYTNRELTTKYNGDAINADTTLYAKWQQVVTVTFDSNGGSSVPSQEIEKGTKATAPTSPTKETEDNGNNSMFKYTFRSWLKEDGTVFNFDDVITSDITLKANYKKDIEVKDGYNLNSSTIDFADYSVASNSELTSFTSGVFEVSADGDKNEIEDRSSTKTWTKDVEVDATLVEGTTLCTGLSGVKTNQFETLENETTLDFTRCYLLGGKKKPSGSGYTSFGSLDVTCTDVSYIIVYAEVSQGIGILNTEDSTYTEVVTASGDNVAQYVFSVSAGSYKIYRTSGSGRVYRADCHTISKK